MSLIQQLDMYQTQLRSTQFISKVRFVKELANYIKYDPNNLPIWQSVAKPQA